MKIINYFNWMLHYLDIINIQLFIIYLHNKSKYILFIL